MTAADFMATTAGLVVCAITVAAALDHVAARHRFSVALREQRVWPPRLIGAVAVATVAAEVAVAIAVVAALITSTPAGRRAFVVTAGLYIAYMLYTMYLLRRRPGVDCGCSRARLPVTVWVPARAAVLTVASAIVAALFDDVVSPAAAPSAFATCALAAGTLTFALWYLPAAMSVTPAARVVEVQAG